MMGDKDQLAVPIDASESEHSPIERVRGLAMAIAERFFADPCVDDYLLWTGGSLEHFLQIHATSTARALGWWAATTEIPYRTASPARSVSGEKWADGTFVRDGLAVLLEIKAIPKRLGLPLGGAIRDVVLDYASLLSTDWVATVEEKGWGGYVDPHWPVERSGVIEVRGLNIALVHGPRGFPPELRTEIDSGLSKGVNTLRTRLIDRVELEGVADRVEGLLGSPLVEVVGGHSVSEGLLLGWDVPIEFGRAT